MGLLKLKNSNSVDFDPLKKAIDASNAIGAGLPGVLQIIVFGSALQGTFTCDSDIDLLIVIDDSLNTKEFSKKLFQKRWSDIALDLLIKRESDFQRESEVGGVSFLAKREGKLIWSSNK